MGRPRLAVPVYRFHINLTLREGEDDDLITFFRTIPSRRRVAALKVALRSGNMQRLIDANLPDDEELADALDELLL